MCVTLEFCPAEPRTLVQANIGFVSKKPLEKLDVLIFPLMTWRKPP